MDLAWFLVLGMLMDMVMEDLGQVDQLHTLHLVLHGRRNPSLTEFLKDRFV